MCAASREPVGPQEGMTIPPLLSLLKYLLVRLLRFSTSLLLDDLGWSCDVEENWVVPVII